MTSPTAPWETDGDVYHQMAGAVFGYWAAWTVCEMADLSIADHLAEGSLTVAEVAAREGSAPETTHRLMRAAVSIGLLTEEAGGRFKSTPLLDTLRSDDPRSLRPFVLSMMDSWLPWNQLVTGIREGQSPFPKVHGRDAFEYLAAHPDEAERFSAAMTTLTGLWG
jgi:hypothetical protein